MDPWQRQPAETSVAFAAFAVYRDGGPQRSLSKTAAVVAKHPTLIERWSRRHAWRARVFAFDAGLDRQQLHEAEQARRDMMVRHTRQAMLLAAKVVEALGQVEGDMLTTSDIARWLEVAQKLERSARGAPAERDATRDQYLALWEKLGGEEQLPA